MKLICKSCKSTKIAKIVGIAFVLLNSIFAQPSVALDVNDSRYLLTRTGFGATAQEIMQLEDYDREAAVDMLLDGIRQKAITPTPTLIFDPNFDHKSFGLPESLNHRCVSNEARKNVQDWGKIWFVVYYEHQTIKSWWWREILQTTSPMTEKLTLFWHEHFATALKEWSTPTLSYLVTLRKHAAGNFKELAKAILREPAMLNYLDNTENVIGHSNENLAREFLELFTLGEGHYTEDDIKALGRILAGHGVDPTDCSYRYNAAEAEHGPITFFGKTDTFTLDSAVDTIFENERVAEFIVEKLWQDFISPKPDAEEVAKLAELFRNENYELKPLLKSLFTHKAFWDKKNRGTLVKSPVELLAGTARSFGIWMPDPDLLMMDSAVLQQDLLDPPSVDGWPHNLEWLNPRTMMLRAISMNRLWQARSNSDRLRTAAYRPGTDMTIRVASAAKGTDQPSFKVVVNGKEVAHFVTHAPMPDGLREKTGYRALPETFHVSAKKLPETIETVQIVFTNSNSECVQAAAKPAQIIAVSVTGKHDDATPPCKMQNENSLFVHWIEVGERKYAGNLAKQHFIDYPQLSESVPIGSLYHNASLTFDLEKMRKLYEKTSPDGKTYMSFQYHTPLIAESYTQSHGETTAFRPAGRSLGEIEKDPAEAFQKLGTPEDARFAGIPVAAILPVPVEIEDTNKSENPLQVLTLSTPYQFK